MPLTYLYLTDEAYTTLKGMAREYPLGRLPLNRYLSRATMGWSLHSRPINNPSAPTFANHTQLLRMLTQGGANYGRRGHTMDAYDFRRKRAINLAPHVLTYLAAVAEHLKIPTKIYTNPRGPSSNSLAALALEYIARDWIYFEPIPARPADRS